MRICKITYRDRTSGKQWKSAKWYCDFFDHNSLRHKIPAFTNKRLSEAMGCNIEALVDCRKAGHEPNAKLNQWIETMTDSLLRKFVSWGVIEGQRTETTKPLYEHIGDYIKVLSAKDIDRDSVIRTRNRLKKIVSECRFYYFRDITQSRVQIYSGRLKKDGYGVTSRGHYLDTLKTFLNWAEQDQRITKNPISRMEKPSRDSKRKGILTPEQFVRLIKITAEKNILIGKTTGQERSSLYIVAGTTGLRRKELLLLTWADINLTPGNAFIRVRACIAKNAKEALQPLPPATIGVLQAIQGIVRLNDNDRVFASFGQWINTAGLLREDLRIAGIPLTDRDGNEICFHSLRNSFISFLANSQTPAKVIQKMARHSDPKLTFNTYARTFEKSEQEAVTFLPNFGNFVFPPLLPITTQNVDSMVDNHRQSNQDNDTKNAFLADKQIPPRGVEPLLPG